jgi:hypothetical protein
MLSWNCCGGRKGRADPELKHAHFVTTTSAGGGGEEKWKIKHSRKESETDAEAGKYDKRKRKKEADGPRKQFPYNMIYFLYSLLDIFVQTFFAQWVA